VWQDLTWQGTRGSEEQRQMVAKACQERFTRHFVNSWKCICFVCFVLTIATINVVYAFPCRGGGGW
jgi:hypothetical protein